MESDNKRIAKNTIILYMRSFLMMAIGLYSSRVILQVLGISDYGLYGAIGSIVAMFSMINGVLSVGTSRFLTFELGRKDEVRLKKTFGAAFTMHFGLAIILFVLLETIGLWFVNNKLNIPSGREFASNVVYQLSILTSMLSLTQVPYSASIISHEKMNIYAYVGIVEASFKLILIFALLYIPFDDNLIAYAIIIAVWSLGLQLFYRIYCYNRFPESHLSIVKDKSVYKNLLGYSMWDFVGQFCFTGNSQGLNLLLNMFFGVMVNSGRAVAYQVEAAVTQFSNNFMTSLQPQIVKSYARKDYNRFLELITEGGLYSFFLLYILSLPLFLEADYILSLWLVEVPDTASSFLRFIIYYTLFRIPNKTIVQGVHATGNIRYLNLTSGLYSASTYLLFIYIAYKLGAPYWSCFIIQAVNGLLITYFELNSLKRNFQFNINNYVSKVYCKAFVITIVSAIPGFVCVLLLQQGVFRLFVNTFISVFSALVCIYYMGFNNKTRIKVRDFLFSKIRTWI